MPDNKIMMEEINTAMSMTQMDVQKLSMILSSVVNQFGEVKNLMEKTRDYTKDELVVFEKYKASMVQMASEYRKLNADQTKGMNDYSVALKGIEDIISNVNSKMKETQAAIESMEAEQKKHNAVIDEEAAKLRQIADLEEQRDKIQKSRKKVDKERVKEFNTEIGQHKKYLVDNKESVTVAKNKNKEISEELKNRRQIKLEGEKEVKSLKEKEQKFKDIGAIGKQKSDEERRRRGFGGGMGMGLQMASDLHIPGVSQAAMIAKYAQAAMPAGGSEGNVGLAGMLGRGAMGAVVGAGVIAGGMGVKHGYDVYGYGNQLAPKRRKLEGLLGQKGLEGFTSGATAEPMTKLGYGAMENYDFMQQFSRQLGGKKALEQTVDVSRLARGYGAERGELGGQAEALMTVGGGGKQGEIITLKNIMSEGVKGGVDRARITQFTSQAINVQKEILQTTGENSAESIAQELSTLMKASGRGEAFFSGPEMAAIRSIDSVMKQVSRGGGGSTSATFLRAFGFAPGGAEPENKEMKGKPPAEQYFEAMKFMEGGLFGGEEEKEGKGRKKGQGAVDRLQKIMGTYMQESGGDKIGAAIRMKQETGLGFNQFEKLRITLEKAKSPDLKKQEEALKEIAQLQKETKDPLSQITETLAKKEAVLADSAVKNAGMIGNIEKAVLGIRELQEKELDAFKNVLKVWGVDVNASGDKKVVEDKGVVGQAVELNAKAGRAVINEVKDFGKGVFKDLQNLAPSIFGSPTKEKPTPRPEPKPKSEGNITTEEVFINKSQFVALLEAMKQSASGITEMADNARYNGYRGNAGGSVYGEASV